MTTISLSVDALFWGRIFDERQSLFIAFAALAALVTAAIAIPLERSINVKKPETTRFATMFMLLAIGTMGATFLASALYTLPFLWPAMEPITTSKGLNDMVFFLLAHGYSFAATAARQFLPLGVISLSLAALFYCVIYGEREGKPHYGIEP